jgi:formylglycine-generating enzyme required for sulfatase activity
MLRCSWMVVALGLVPALPLLGSQGGGKQKEDPLIAAMKFMKVPKGVFWMGGGTDRAPTKQVEIKQDFELAAYTVTQEQWQALMDTNPSYFSRQSGGNNTVKDIADADLNRFPVESVSWNDVQDFLTKLNDKVKAKGWVYRLPTQAEWEYACRGAATSKEECSFDFYLDKPTNDLSSKQANFDGSRPAGKGEKGPYLGRPTKVGSYAPNKLGLYDMHGNVWQWCADLWHAQGPERAIRGSSWHFNGLACYAAFNRPELPSYRSIGLGFRLARLPSGSK